MNEIRGGECRHGVSMIGGASCYNCVLEENAQLKERGYRILCELADIKESYASIMKEPCREDEKHCTCVPALRAEIAGLKADEKKLLDNLSDECQEKEKFMAEVEMGKKLFPKCACDEEGDGPCSVHGREMAQQDLMVELKKDNAALLKALKLTAFDWLEQMEAGGVCDECDQEIGDTMDSAFKAHLPGCYVGEVRRLASRGSV